MDKLFNALRELHVGYDVVDLRLLANAQEVNGRQGPEMDHDFAESVRRAKPIQPTYFA